MSCDILIRSYYKDFRWLGFSLRSIQKFCSGFRDVILVIPGGSHDRFSRLDLPVDRLFVCGDYPDDYLGQQVTKLHADTYTDADHICHVDSDCIFDRKLSPEDLLPEGKPQIVMTPYRELPQSLPWKRITEKFLGRTVAFEFMRRQPVLFPRWLYPEMRAFAEKRHRMDVANYVTQQPHRGFSEYNALGAFAYYHFRDRFSWIEASGREPVRQLCRWYWSWGGLTERIETELEEVLSGV